MTYQESAALMTDPVFRGRVKVAALKYADEILRKPDNPLNLLRWAQLAFTQPDQTAASIQPSVVMQPAVQEQGANVTDSNLQFAVDQTVARIV